MHKIFNNRIIKSNASISACDKADLLATLESKTGEKNSWNISVPRYFPGQYNKKIKKTT